MNKLSALLLLLSFTLLVGGAALLSTAAALILAGVLTGTAGVMSLRVSQPTEKEPR